MQLCFVIFQSLGTIDFSYVFGSYHVSVKGCGTSSFLDNGILKQLLKKKVPEKLRSRHFFFFLWDNSEVLEFYIFYLK